MRQRQKRGKASERIYLILTLVKKLTKATKGNLAMTNDLMVKLLPILGPTANGRGRRVNLQDSQRFYIFLPL